MHPDQRTLLHMLDSAGFASTDFHNMTGGIVTCTAESNLKMLTLLQDTALSGLEMAINQALNYDPASRAALANYRQHYRYTQQHAALDRHCRTYRNQCQIASGLGKSL